MTILLNWLKYIMPYHVYKQMLIQYFSPQMQFFYYYLLRRDQLIKQLTLYHAI